MHLASLHHLICIYDFADRVDVLKQRTASSRTETHKSTKAMSKGTQDKLQIAHEHDRHGVWILTMCSAILCIVY